LLLFNMDHAPSRPHTERYKTVKHPMDLSTECEEE